MRHLPCTTAAVAMLLTSVAGGLSAAPAPAGPCPTVANVAVGVAPPPPLPDEPQPPLPAYGYVWTPGYWAWNGAVNDYYWSPGVWVLPPAIGALWTPGYWGWNDGVYIFNTGYWGPSVGFYGGINYGYGYFGHGYQGGYWRGRTFYYNSAVNRFGGVHVNAVYAQRVGGFRGASRVSYAGGAGGVRAQATPGELAAAREAHVPATAGQAANAQRAALDPGLRAGPNHGHPHLATLAAVGVAAYGAGRLAAHASAHAPAHASGYESARGVSRPAESGRSGAEAFRGQPHGAAARPSEGASRSFREPTARPNPGFAPPRQTFRAPRAAERVSGGGHPGGGHQGGGRPEGGRPEGGHPGGGHPGGGERRR